MIPNSEKTVLSNGLKVLTESMPSLRSVAVGIMVGAGPAFELEPEAGLSHFAEHMAFKGTPTRSAFDIAHELDSVGGKINAFTAKEFTVFYAVVLDKHVNTALDVVSDIFLNPLLKPADIDMERGVILEEIRMYEDTPDENIHDLFAQTILSGHPVGRPTLGSMDTVRSFKQSDFQKYRSRLYCPDNVIFSVAGNITHNQIVEMAQARFGSWSSKAKVAKGQMPELKGATKVKKKKTEQVHMCLGAKGVSQLDEDRFAFGIMENILGGSMSSRLFQEVREKRGLVYSIYSTGLPTRDFGLFYVYAGCAKQNLNQVIDLVLLELGRIKKEGITAEELNRAREQIKGSMVLGLESSSSRMSYLAKSEFYYNRTVPIEEIFDKVDKVTNEDIVRIACDLFQNKYLTLTVIGDLNKLNLELKI